MKKLFCLFVCLFMGSLFANWEEERMQGEKFAKEANYPAAEKAFNLAIAELEETQNKDHDDIYIDRAEVYNLQHKFAEALLDVNQALASPHLSNAEKVRGLLERITAQCHLKMDQEVLADYDQFKALHPNFPTVEYTKNTVIIRNIPKCPCYEKLAKALLVASEICAKESDIQIRDGMCIGKRKLFDNRILAASRTQGYCNECVNDCKFWCDKCALIGIEWCVNVFKTYKCQKSCLCAVDLIRDKCKWCCRRGHSDKKCVRPFENIIYHMDRSCDPWCHDD